MLTAPRIARSPPLLPVFLHVVVHSIVAAADEAGTRPEQRPPALTAELLVGVISSALTGASHLEWALTAGGEDRNVLRQSVASVARRLSGDLRRRSSGGAARMVQEKLTAMQSFVANFPTFTADV